MRFGQRTDRPGEQFGGDRGQPGGVVSRVDVPARRIQQGVAQRLANVVAPVAPAVAGMQRDDHVGWAHLDVVDHPVAEQGTETSRCVTHSAAGRQPVSGDDPAQLLRVRGGGGVDRNHALSPIAIERATNAITQARTNM